MTTMLRQMRVRPMYPAVLVSVRKFPDWMQPGWNAMEHEPTWPPSSLPAQISRTTSRPDRCCSLDNDDNSYTDHTDRETDHTLTDHTSRQTDRHTETDRQTDRLTQRDRQVLRPRQRRQQLYRPHRQRDRPHTDRPHKQTVGWLSKV